MPHFYNPYPHLGALHNEGVNFVIHRLTVTEAEPITITAILNHTAEFMYISNCCNESIDSKPDNQQYLKIKVVEYSDFLYQLHHVMRTKAVSDWIEESNISLEKAAILKLLLATDDSFDTSTITSLDNYPPYYLIDTLAKEAVRGADIPDTDRRVVGMLTSVGRESIHYAWNVSRDAKRINSLASMASRADFGEKVRTEPDSPQPNIARNLTIPEKKFRWSWKGDLEGAIAGLVSGAISGAAGGLAVAGVGGALGALGGAVSTSLIKSIPAFQS